MAAGVSATADKREYRLKATVAFFAGINQHSQLPSLCTKNEVSEIQSRVNLVRVSLCREGNAKGHPQNSMNNIWGSWSQFSQN